MEVSIKYSAISYDGENVSFVETHTCPDLKLITDRKFEGYQLPSVSVESQILDWLDEQDKHYLIDKHNLMCILDYEVFTGPKLILPDFFEEHYKEIQISESLKNDIIATYAEMKNSLDGLTFDQQWRILFDAVLLGHKAAGEAYRRISAILKGEDPDAVQGEPIALIDNQ